MCFNPFPQPLLQEKKNAEFGGDDTILSHKGVMHNSEKKHET